MALRHATSAFEFDLVPAQIDQLADPQAVTERDQDHGGVAMTPAIAPRGVDQFLDLGLGQIFAGAQFGIGSAPRHVDCLYFVVRRHEPEG